MKPSRLTLVLGGALALVFGCDPGSDTTGPHTVAFNPAGGGMQTFATGAGVTVGGQQDIGAAREIIESGGIPSSSAIAAEGLFSEHDFTPSGATCGQLLCIDPAVALYSPVMSDSDRVLIQLAMTSNIDASTFRHQPSILAVVVDRSGSMGTTKMEGVKAALAEVLDLLPYGDEVMLISFNHEYTIDLEFGALSEWHRSAAAEAIGTWQSGGTTDIEGPLRRAFEELDDRGDDGEHERRVLLFTDALPNTGKYETEDFTTLATRYAEKGIGLTAFGIGLDFGADLAKEISEIRGGNYVFLRDVEEMQRMLTEDLEFLLSPIAYDFSLSVEPGNGLALSNVYGMPGGDDAEFSMSAATLFLSRRGGTVAVELAGQSETIPPGSNIADIRLRYTPVGGSPVEFTVTPTMSTLTNGADGMQASDEQVQKLVALVNMATCMRNSLVLWEDGDRQQPLDILDALRSHLDKVATALDDADLTTEVDLVAKLRDNMQGYIISDGTIAD